MDTIKERLVEYLKINGVSKKDFSEKTGISLWNLTGKSMQSEIGGAQISQSLGYFPNLNPDWLLLGIGEMDRQPQPDPGTAQAMIDKISELSAKLALLEKENQELKEKLKSASAKIHKAVNSSL